MSNLNIACHLWAYNDLSLEDALGTIARLGFRYVDIGSGPHLDLEAAAKSPGREAQRIRDLLNYYDLQLADLYLLLPYLNDADPDRRDAQLSLFERLIPFAIALETPGITISPGVEGADGPAVALARSVPVLMDIVQAVEDVDVRISFEPHMDSPVTTPDTALAMVQAIPGMSLTLDPAHFLVQGYRMNEIEPLLPYTAHLHLRQAVKGRLQTPFRQGRLDLQELVADLIRADYFGMLTIEYAITVGWHGMMAVNITQEIVTMRDALRDLKHQATAM